mgnify:CR=1 FL=1
MAKSNKIVYLGTGRRKSSVARVRLVEGTGKITINGKDYGVTPRNISGLVIGKHKVELYKEEFGRVTVTVSIKKDEVAEYTVDLRENSIEQAKDAYNKEDYAKAFEIAQKLAMNFAKSASIMSTRSTEPRWRYRSPGTTSAPSPATTPTPPSPTLARGGSRICSDGGTGNGERGLRDGVRI